MAVTKEQLLARKFGQQEIDIPGVGTVAYRPLTRAEALAVQGKDMTLAEVEQLLLSLALVDPKLSVEDVKAWQDVAPAGELQPIVEAITRASGLKAESPKEAVQRFRD